MREPRIKVRRDFLCGGWLVECSDCGIVFHRLIWRSHGRKWARQHRTEKHPVVTP